MTESAASFTVDVEQEDDDPGSDVGSLWTESVPEDLSLPEIECGPDCPLRKSYVPKPDAPLPLAPGSLQSTREEAAARIYSPIKEWQTRLLQVGPGEFGSIILASLVVVDVAHLSGAVLHVRQQRVHFAALSYTWGAAVFPRSVNINGIECPITENLYAFIQRYRSNKESMYVWVDAICINQFDLDEKATQVSQMLAIFERAHTVVVWLGEQGPNTNLAVDYLRWANCGERVARIAKRDVKGHSKHCLQLVPEVLSGIEDLCSRNWVRRIWVKQEVWAAKRLLVYCGASQLTWSEYLHNPNVVITPIAEQDGENQIDFDAQSQENWRKIPLDEVIRPRDFRPQHRPNIPLGEVICLRNLRNRGEPSQMPKVLNIDELDIHEILRLLNESTDCQTTNTHGSIYALIGMAGIGHVEVQTQQGDPVLTVNVDYNISLGVLYRRLAMSIMLYAGAYSILATDGIFGAQGGFDLPSWTPDFRHPTRCKLLSTYRIKPATTHAVNYRVEDEALIRRFRQLNPVPMFPILRLEGYRMATITTRTIIPSKWELFPIVYSRPRGSGKHAPITDYPFLKPMGVKLVDFVYKAIDKRLRGGPPNLKSDIARYLIDYGAFAVSTEAREDDLIALVETIGIPVVLRPIEQEEGHFNFVGCAWLFSDIAEPLVGDGTRRQSWSPPPWQTLREELMEVSPWHDEVRKRKEIFQVE